MTNPARQRGQSLVLASLLLMVLAVVLLLVFNVGQQTRAKMELQNTADATAYSVATIAARDYNFAAYMNRAMVANQVAAAQWVGLTSWFRFTGRLLENIDLLSTMFPPAKPAIAAIDKAYKSFENIFEKSVLPPVLKVLGNWISALSAAQQVFHVATIEGLLQNLFYKGDAAQPGVLFLNDPDASVLHWPASNQPPLVDGNSEAAEVLKKLGIKLPKIPDVRETLLDLGLVIRDAHDWWTFTKRYQESDPGMERFAKVTLGSLDAFGKDRNWDNQWPWNEHYHYGNYDDIIKYLPQWVKDIIDSLGYLLPVHVSAYIDLSLQRRGGTELKAVDGKYSWSAVDTLMGDGKTHVEVRYACGVKWCCKKVAGKCVLPYTCGYNYCSKTLPSAHVDFPFAWGAAYTQAGDKSSSDIFHKDLDDRQYGGAAATGGFGGSRATFELGVSEFGKKPLASFGLKPYYGVAKPSAQRGQDGPQFLLVVGKDFSKIRTASRAGFGAPGAPTDDTGPFGLGKLHLSEPAPLRFHALAKGKLHFGLNGQYSNLFSPYWEAKLADTTNNERLAAYVSLLDWKDIDLKDLLPTTVTAAPNQSGLPAYAH